jgi:hypothetical protein
MHPAGYRMHRRSSSLNCFWLAGLDRQQTSRSTSLTDLAQDQPRFVIGKGLGPV